jgi:hypothetical protein
MLDVAFFRKINPNYSRLRFTKLANIKAEVYTGFYFDLNILNSNSDKVKSNGTDLAEIKEINFLICYFIILGFSFSNKL